MFKVFYADEYGEVHFIKEEFESILNEVYNAGAQQFYALTQILQILGKIINHIVLIMNQI